MLFFVICNGGQKASSGPLWALCWGKEGLWRENWICPDSRGGIGSDTARWDCGNKHDYRVQYLQSSRSHTWKPWWPGLTQEKQKEGETISGTKRINQLLCLLLFLLWWTAYFYQSMIMKPFSFSLLLILFPFDGATRVNIYSNLLSIRLQSIWVHPFRELLCAAQSVQYSVQIFW